MIRNTLLAALIVLSTISFPIPQVQANDFANGIGIGIGMGIVNKVFGSHQQQQQPQRTRVVHVIKHDAHAAPVHKPVVVQPTSPPVTGNVIVPPAATPGPAPVTLAAPSPAPVTNVTNNKTTNTTFIVAPSPAPTVKPVVQDDTITTPQD